MNRTCQVCGQVKPLCERCVQRWAIVRHGLHVDVTRTRPGWTWLVRWARTGRCANQAQNRVCWPLGHDVRKIILDALRTRTLRWPREEKKCH